MLEKNTFLFGCVEIDEGAVTDTVNQLTELQNARIQVAYNKYAVNISTYFVFFFLHDITYNDAYSARLLT